MGIEHAGNDGDLAEFIAGIIDDPSFVSVTGGGGKTGLLISLARYYSAHGKSVLMTTTVKIQNPAVFNWEADSFHTSADIFSSAPFRQASRVLFADYCGSEPSKVCTPGIPSLKKASELFDVTLCEADGSRSLPLKMHTDRDPVVPRFSTFTVAVMGIWGIGKPVSESVFGASGPGIADANYLDRYIADAQGIMKGEPSLILINGAEEASPFQIETVEKANWPENTAVVACSIRRNSIIRRIR